MKHCTAKILYKNMLHKRWRFEVLLLSVVVGVVVYLTCRIILPATLFLLDVEFFSSTTGEELLGFLDLTCKSSSIVILVL